ncbi:hypothetical protein [Streptomyces sp. NPDC005012]|uniref:hypothetical protein n=1 Tax=Streptomyces sp. NPDC005012 TaxID=3154558 RepID=UPI0033A6F07A
MSTFEITGEKPQSSPFTRGASRARDWLESAGLPFSDEIPLVASHREFDGGGQYGIEVPVVNSYNVLERLIAQLGEAGLPVTRFDETLGAFLLSDSEITDMLSACREAGIGMLFSLGPRSEYDRKSAFYRGSYGKSQGRRINNNDALAVSAQEAIRLAELGCRGLTVYDLGVVSLLQHMKDDGLLPSDMLVKASSHCIISNPLTAQVYARAGMTNATTIHDLGLAALQEMRRISPELVLDVPTDVYGDKGGFIRFYEIPELIQICAPVMLKVGASAQQNPHDAITDEIISKRVQRIRLALDHVNTPDYQPAYINPKSLQRCLPTN